MVTREREIFIKFDRVEEFAIILEEIRMQKEEIKRKFILIDKLNLEENKLFENWENYFEDSMQKLDHITL